MALKRYKRIELNQIVENILKKKAQLLPIGNHELKRHQVYKCVTNDNNYVFKFYYQSNYCDREIAALNVLGQTDIKAPKLIDWGLVDESKEWMMIEFLDGVPLFKVIKHIKDSNLSMIYKEMGEQLGKFHNIKFDFFGDWDPKGQCINKGTDLKNAFLKRGTRVFGLIEKGDLPNIEIIRKAYELMKDNLDLLDEVKESVLCHLDFDTRNILVKRIDGVWHLNSVLDFEHTMPYDRMADFTHLYIKDFKDDSKFKTDLFEGYSKYHKLEVDQKRFNLHLLYHALNICSWACDVAPEYYKLGLSLINDFLEHGLDTEHKF